MPGMDHMKNGQPSSGYGIKLFRTGLFQQYPKPGKKCLYFRTHFTNLKVPGGGLTKLVFSNEVFLIWQFLAKLVAQSFVVHKMLLKTRCVNKGGSVAASSLRLLGIKPGDQGRIWIQFC